VSRGPVCSRALPTPVHIIDFDDATERGLVVALLGISLSVTSQFGDRDRCWNRASTGVGVVGPSVTTRQLAA
jgi:hypothetical protein